MYLNKIQVISILKIQKYSHNNLNMSFFITERSITQIVAITQI